MNVPEWHASTTDTHRDPYFRFPSAVAVTLETVPDLHTVTATLVLPDLGGLSGPVTHFGTFLVLTENRTSIGGPALVTGALQRDTVVKGRGTAQEVAF